MAYLNIVKEGDPILRKTSRPVEEITPRILTLLDDMKDTMHAANGCGLAAVQVGILRRVVIIEIEDGVIYEMINPRIVASSGKQEEQEGCLSVPDKWGITERPSSVTAEYTNREGKLCRLSGEGLLARAICHELDHLDGKLFTDVVIRYITEEE